jgi:hypothetical protein
LLPLSPNFDPPLQIDTIPLLRNRVRCLQYRLQFPGKVSELLPDINKIRDACKEVRKSKKFAKIIQVVLMVGNFLNGGTNKGAALGFKLAVLPKLGDTKTTDNKQSLLHYLVKVLQKKFQDLDVLNVGDELKNVPLAKAGMAIRLSPLAYL